MTAAASLPVGQETTLGKHLACPIKFLRKSRFFAAQGIVEFALVLPLLLLLILGVIELGRLLWIYSATLTASREAARYGSAAGNTGNYVPHYNDCNGIRSAAKRMGTLVGIQDSDIEISYDDGPQSQGTPYSLVCPATDVDLGDRIRIRVQGHYQPIVPLVNLAPFTINSFTARTILKDVIIEGTPLPPAGQPTIYFAAAGSTVDEGVGSVNIQVRLSGPTSKPVTFSIGLSGTASGGGVDYSVNLGSLVIPAGSTIYNVTVDVVDDTMYEASESVILALGGPVNANLGSPAGYQLTITDNDTPPVVSFAAPDQQQWENQGTVSVMVVLDNPSSLDVIVPFTLSGTALPGGIDYDIASSQVQINAGSTSAYILVNLKDDTLDEDDETAVLTLGTPTNATKGLPDVHTLWILDDDIPPWVSFTWASQMVGEDVGTVTVQVELNVPSGKDISVPFSVGGTATGIGVDYVLTTQSPLSIPAGSMNAQISIDIIADSVPEVDETILLDLSVPVNANLGSPNRYTLTVSDNYQVQLPVVTFNIASQTRSEGSGYASISAQLSSPYIQDVVVPFTVSGTASGSGVDYTISSSPVVIPAGGASVSIQVVIIDDIYDEVDETVIVSMGTPTNGNPGAITVHTLTIADDDGQPTISFNVSGQTGREDSGNMTVLVQLSAITSLDVSVPFSVSGSAQGGGVDYTLSPTTTVSIPAGGSTASITINLVDDSLVELQDETVVLTLGSPVNATLGTPNVHTATITDDDVLACPVADVPVVSGSKLSFNLYNTHANAALVEIESFVIYWASSFQQAELRTINVANVLIWSGNYATSPSVINGPWQGNASDRQIQPGSYKSIQIDFFKNLDVTKPQSATIIFMNGCVANAPP